MSDVELDYQYLTDNALRGVVRDVLNVAAELGAAPGEHHFYIEFVTQAAGVDIPDFLVDAYPDRMTIVLQHQFKDLDVGDEAFSVTLWFKGEAARLTVPFEKVTNFADPSVQFALRFNPPEAEEDAAPTVDVPRAAKRPNLAPSDPLERRNDDGAPDEEREGADIVSLDAFRKK
ncbi:MAG: SspB family protein [Parvularculaceae bacterium]